MILGESINGDIPNLRTAEEGAIKSNPLLSLSTSFFQVDSTQSESNSSDTEATSDIIRSPEDKGKQVISLYIQCLSVNILSTYDNEYYVQY